MATFNFTGEYALHQGATFNRRFYVKNDDGSVVNITGFTVKMQVRKNFNSDAVALELSTAAGDATVTGSSGYFELLKSATATALLVPGEYIYDLELTNGSNVQRILQGAFHILPEVTR